MLTSEQINDLHRMYWSERCSIRKIERHLSMLLLKVTGNLRQQRGGYISTRDTMVNQVTDKLLRISEDFWHDDVQCATKAQH